MGIEENIAAGKILYLNVCFPHETKFNDKYFVVVGIGTGTCPLLLKINTSGELSSISKRLGESQFKIKQSVYRFLQHDSYLDCGTVWYTLIATEEAIKQISKEPKKRIVGEVTADHKNEIIRRIEKSKSIAPRHKKAIAEALRKKT